MSYGLLAPEQLTLLTLVLVLFSLTHVPNTTKVREFATDWRFLNYEHLEETKTTSLNWDYLSMDSFQLNFYLQVITMKEKGA